MDIHGAALSVKGVAPDLVQEPVPGEDHAPVFHQGLQKVVFLQREGNRLVIHPDLMPGDTEGETAHPVLVLYLPGNSPAEQCPDPGQQLHHAKGLGHIVVGSGIQTKHLVILGALGGEHHHGNQGGFGIGTEGFQNVQTVLLRQHDVQHDELRQTLFHGIPERSGMAEALSLQRGAVQSVGHQLPDGVVILHKIDHRDSPFRSEIIITYIIQQNLPGTSDQQVKCL